MSAALPNATAWITVVETSQGPSRQVNWTKMRGVDHSPLFSEAQTQAYATAARADLDAAIERKDALLRQALEILCCTDSENMDDPGHRCGHCDDYVDRNGTLRAELRKELAK